MQKNKCGWCDKNPVYSYGWIDKDGNRFYNWSCEEHRSLASHKQSTALLIDGLAQSMESLILKSNKKDWDGVVDSNVTS